MLNFLISLVTGKPVRKVLLIRYDNSMKIVDAHYSQSGWVANWWGLDYTNSILLPDGTTAGYNSVKKWLPHSGWDGTEFGETSQNHSSRKVQKEQLCLS